MDGTWIALIEPFPAENDDLEREPIGACLSEEELTARWDEYKLVKQALLQLGFEVHSLSMSVNCEGCNWESSFNAEILKINNQNVKVLAGKLQEIAELRKQALNKLTVEEQHALGLITQPYVIPAVRVGNTLFHRGTKNREEHL